MKILEMLNSVLSTNAETTTSNLYLRANKLSNFIDSAEKGDAVNHASTSTLHRVN